MAEKQSKATLSIFAIVAALLALAVSFGSLVTGGRLAPGLAASGQVSPLADKTPVANEGLSNAVANTQALQALTEELRQEQASRLQLQRQVDRLEEELGDATGQMQALQERLDQAGQGTASSAPETQAVADSVTPATNEEIIEAHRSVFAGGDGFAGFGRTRSREERIGSLQSAGVDEVRANELVQLIDQNQLAELELRDKAARGGWQDSDEFAQRLEQLEAEAPDLREELGDEAYDRYLFASGSTNRVVIGSVINGSAASVAGFEAGDTLLSYAGQRLFNIQELQSATRSGVRGENVQVTLLRDGATLNLSVTRGPLGVTLTREGVRPW